MAIAGCYSAEIDAALEGAYACTADSDCPSSLVCDGRRCVSEVPSVTILSPESLQQFALANSAAVSVRVRATGLEFGDDATGFVRVTIDQQVFEINEGAISSGITLQGVEVAPVAGAHRITAQAVRTSGQDFENPSARATRLFWLDDGRPHVAIAKPWPGDSFDLENPLIDVEIVANRFQFTQADGNVADPADVARIEQLRFGHAHVYYDKDFPTCAASECDADYIAVVTPQPGERPTQQLDTSVTLPTSPEASASLTAVLRRNDHSPFVPSAAASGVLTEDGTAAPRDDRDLVFEAIEIMRVSGG